MVFRRQIYLVMIALAMASIACRTISQPGGTPEGAEISGEKIFQRYGCSGCHTGEATGIAPALQGLFGKEVRLESGEAVIADEDYVRESILYPSAKIVLGYQPIMPSFQDQITEEQQEALIEYIRSLAE